MKGINLCRTIPGMQTLTSSVVLRIMILSSPVCRLVKPAVSAASVAAQIRFTFGGIRMGLLMGIGGGVPSAEHHIRLEDVVVSQPGIRNGGIVQYDFGKTVEDGKFVQTGS